MDNEPNEYAMTVHPFGAVSSPSFANFALKRTADDNQEEYGEDVAKVVRRNIYVDDMLMSVSTTTIGHKLIHDTINMASKGGFPLGKVISNSKNIIDAVTAATRTKSIKSLDLQKEPLPAERALDFGLCNLTLVAV